MPRTIPLLVTLFALPASALSSAALPTDELEDRTRSQRPAESTPEVDRAVKLIAELGTALAKGNTDVFHINGDARLILAPGADWVLETRARALYETSKGEETANNWLVSERADRFLSQRLSLFAAAAIERNVFAGLDRRLSGQLGAAFLAWETRDAAADDLITNRLRLEAGFYGAREDLTLPPRSPADAVLEESLRRIYAARAAASYVHAISKNSSGGFDVEVIQDFVDTANVVVNSSVYVAAALAEGFALKITAAHHFDNVPPPADPPLAKSDWLLTAGLVVSL
ncbi:MAG TPA: DUF481 domain-containing protein [Vulgatibacter sp.]|nr:DUF481 domain-containing protein [Vulgatibacter sp.]